MRGYGPAIDEADSSADDDEIIKNSNSNVGSNDNDENNAVDSDNIGDGINISTPRQSKSPAEALDTTMAGKKRAALQTKENNSNSRVGVEDDGANDTVDPPRKRRTLTVE